jgi:ADP-L-glycero-D-manno-heptose 6-epimerase
VKDAVKMTCAFLDVDAGGIYNIGQGQVTTWNQLAHALFAGLGKPTRIVYIDMPESLSKQYQNYTCATMDKFHTLFSGASRKIQTTSTSDGVKEYVQEYLMRNARW